jgi:[acyl-carrier-protein] S-malonyltransferase
MMMSDKIAFLFAGQGAQVVGMGKEIYETYETAREFFDHACDLVDFDMKQLCFDGPLEKLSQTEYTQACLVAVELMILRVLNTQGIEANVCVGLSLGEYSALVAAGALDADDAVKLVRVRGQIMSEALPVGISSMAAVLGIQAADLEVICQELTDTGVVEIANYNCPGQLVIGGEVEAVKCASELAIKRGARKIVPLKVSGAFHTSLLKGASIKLRKELDQVNFKELRIPVVFNKTATYQNASLEDLLEAQVCSSVRFEESIHLLLEEGVETFIEIGPGKTLSGFVKKMDQNVTTYQVSDVAGINKLIENLGGNKSYDNE